MTKNVRFTLNRVRKIRIGNRIKKILNSFCAITIKNFREKFIKQKDVSCISLDKLGAL